MRHGRTSRVSESLLPLVIHGHALVLSDVAIACAKMLNEREANEPWCTSMEEALSDLLVHSEKRVQRVQPAMEE